MSTYPSKRLFLGFDYVKGEVGHSGVTGHEGDSRRGLSTLAVHRGGGGGQSRYDDVGDAYGCDTVFFRDETSHRAGEGTTTTTTY